MAVQTCMEWIQILKNQKKPSALNGSETTLYKQTKNTLFFSSSCSMILQLILFMFRWTMTQLYIACSLQWMSYGARSCIILYVNILDFILFWTYLAFNHLLTVSTTKENICLSIVGVLPLLRGIENFKNHLERSWKIFSTNGGI